MIYRCIGSSTTIWSYDANVLTQTID